MTDQDHTPPNAPLSPEVERALTALDRHVRDWHEPSALLAHLATLRHALEARERTAAPIWFARLNGTYHRCSDEAGAVRACANLNETISALSDPAEPVCLYASPDSRTP